MGEPLQAESSPDRVWIFGYGANMNADHMRQQKGVEVMEHRRCVLPGYRMRFNLVSLYTKSEPAFCSIEPADNAVQEEEEVHGVAFCVSEADVLKVDSLESSYIRRPATLRDYEGRELSGFVYESRPDRRRASEQPDGRPSHRYLSLLVQGAVEAGLQRRYVRRLLSVPTHEPDTEDVAARQKFLERPLDAFARLSWQQAPPHCVSLFGYIFHIGESWNANVNAMHGKELSLLLVRLYHGGQLRAEAAPPYPTIDCVRRLAPDGLDYALTWLDTFLHIASGECVGRLVEYETQCTDSELTLPQPTIYPLQVLRDAACE